MNSPIKKPTNLDKDLCDRFETFYPRLRGLFLERCLTLAIQNKDFFDEVFFNPIFIEVK